MLLPGKQGFQRVLGICLLLLLRLLWCRVKGTQEGAKGIRGGEAPTLPTTTTKVTSKTKASK